MKRVASSAFALKGSISIEAAIVLSVFLCAVLSVMSFAIIINQQLQLSSALKNTCTRLAAAYYIYNEASEALSVSEELQNTAGYGMGLISAENMLKAELEDTGISVDSILGGYNGISLFLSSFPDEKGYIDLVMTYKMKLPFSPVPLPDIYIMERSRIHTWTGDSAFNKEEKEVQYVYMTKNGSVYHISRDCKHLNLTLKTVSIERVDYMRNRSGAKYYKCEICGKELTAHTVYITEYGNAYHTEASCPGITRDIKRVKLSDICGVPACKSCGE